MGLIPAKLLQKRSNDLRGQIHLLSQTLILISMLLFNIKNHNTDKSDLFHVGL